MSREDVPLFIPDLSQFSKNLRHALSQQDSVPGHLSMLHMISQAAGHRNYQTLQAQSRRQPLPEVDERALRVFDIQGVMQRWPSLRAVQSLCLWVIWTKMPARQDLSEPEVNAVLKTAIAFDDHVLLRRALISEGRMQRTKDGRVYRRIEQQPPPEARALIRSLLDRVH